ncbi:hypothetical protein KIPB_011460, partial [Kipferlia bialata]
EDAKASKVELGEQVQSLQEQLEQARAHNQISCIPVLVNDPLTGVDTGSKSQADVSMDGVDQTASESADYRSMSPQASPIVPGPSQAEVEADTDRVGVQGDYGNEAYSCDDSSESQSGFDEDQSQTEEESEGGDVRMSSTAGGVPVQGAEARAIPATPVSHHRTAHGDARETPVGGAVVRTFFNQTPGQLRKRAGRESAVVENHRLFGVYRDGDSPVKETGATDKCKAGPTDDSVVAGGEARAEGEVAVTAAPACTPTITPAESVALASHSQELARRCLKSLSADARHFLRMRYQPRRGRNKGGLKTDPTFNIELLVWDAALYLKDWKNIVERDRKFLETVKMVLTSLAPVDEYGVVHDTALDRFTHHLRRPLERSDLYNSNGDKKHRNRVLDERKREAAALLGYFRKGTGPGVRTLLYRSLEDAIECLDVRGEENEVYYRDKL